MKVIFEYRLLVFVTVACFLPACRSTPGDSIAACKPPAQIVEIDAPRASVTYEARGIRTGPVGLWEASGVWTGTEYLIFGGSNPDVPKPEGTYDGSFEWEASPEGSPWTSPGYGYNPTTNRWRRLPGRMIRGTTGGDPAAWHCGRAFILNRYGEGFRYHTTRGYVDLTATEGAPKNCYSGTMRAHGPYAMLWGCRGCLVYIYDRRHDAWSQVDLTPAGEEYGHCGHGIDNIVGERYVVMFHDGSGSYWEIGAEDWTPIVPPQTPMRVDSGPVGDADALYVLGQLDRERAVYRYDLRMRTWWPELVTGELCSSPVVALRDGVLISAGNIYSRGPFSCGYDLANALQVGVLPEHPTIEGNVVILGDDQIFVWANNERTQYNDGGMPRVPTVWLDNTGWLIDYRVER